MMCVLHTVPCSLNSQFSFILGVEEQGGDEGLREALLLNWGYLWCHQLALHVASGKESTSAVLEATIHGRWGCWRAHATYSPLHTHLQVGQYEEKRYGKLLREKSQHVNN